MEQGVMERMIKELENDDSEFRFHAWQRYDSLE
jgi:hypothetical protein